MMKDKKIDFRVNYKNVHVLDEINTKDIRYPIILSSPHSGHFFPKEFYDNVKVDEKDLKVNEEWFVDELIEGAINQGFATLLMNVSRAFVDVNRDKIEIDPDMYFDYTNSDDCGGSRRCRVGYGVIHRILHNGRDIYDGKISYYEALDRIKNVYDEYHKKLSKLIDKTVKKFGYCFVLDCHSMPSKIGAMMLDDKPIDICLGTLFEQSCPNEMSDFFMNKFKEEGYNTLYNTPYSGAYITFNYCQPRKKVFTMQLEINRGLYMNEKTFKKNKQFQKISSDISKVIVDFSKFVLDFKI
ncbi:MAG: N-formylglutamate amidohydrolase [Lactobacillus sp.]|jgi:N-formylglutamate amidohydrolase|nr:N-formylglutamate amidohydrolase [Lactobacillus sp.]